MTQSLATNAANNDIYLSPDGNLVLLNGLLAVENVCANASKTQLGECVLQTGIGIPNFQVIWVGVPDYAIWQAALLQTLLSVEGVTNVNDIQVTAQNNVLAYTANIETEFGPSTING